MINALTIDVEDYFQVTAFSNIVDRDDWNIYPSRVVQNTSRILELLSEYDLKATFFVLGWVADRFPMLVREISDLGHEVACHGFGHELIYNLTPESFRRDIHTSKSILEDITGRRVLGYRAPSYSITDKSLWALDILVEEGFAYDSSIFPVYHDNYGIPSSARFPYIHTRPHGNLHEFPLSTFRAGILGKRINIPIAGGGYLRFLPVKFLGWCIKRVNNFECQPTVLYFHPWEIDPDQPRIHSSLKSRFRHYVNLNTTEQKLLYLFNNFQFNTMKSVLGFDNNV